MVSYNRVINVPARIVSDDIEFKGRALYIPLLRDKINSMIGKLSEQEIIALAESIVSTMGEKEQWRQIKNDIVDSQHNNCTIHANWWRLRKFINKYSNN